MSMMECSVCHSRADARQFQRCVDCGAALCDDCAERYGGMCMDCADDEQ